MQTYDSVAALFAREPYAATNEVTDAATQAAVTLVEYLQAALVPTDEGVALRLVIRRDTPATIELAPASSEAPAIGPSGYYGATGRHL